jgi:bifunctional oligoribonuclease and PAP phosphatase NrnA
MMERIAQQIKASKNILLASHMDPDGDSVGSLLALGLALESANIKTTLFNESIIPAVYRFLPGVERIRSGDIQDPAIYDLVILLDCSSLERTGNASSAIRQIPFMINIDHHATNTFFGTLNWVSPEACASSEIVYTLINCMHLPISKEIATSIYTGILSDTGSFRFSNTNENAFSICMEMVRYGVDPSFVAQHVYGPFSLNRLKLLNRALDSLEISENGKLSIMSLSRESFRKTNTQPEDTDGFLNYARNIKDIKVAALIQEQENPSSEGKNGNRSGSAPAREKSFHVSLRSNGLADVAAIALSFDGGGHSSAAGFTISSNLKEIKSRLFKLSETL